MRAISSRPNYKVGAAAAVNPDTAHVVAPGAALGAGRAAALVGHARFAPSVDRTIMPAAIIRSAGNVPAPLGSRPALCPQACA